MRKFECFKGRLSVVIMMTLAAFVFFQANASKTEDVFAKAKDKIASAKTLTASFTLTVNGTSTSGKIYSKGNRFALITDKTSNWYNGKDLYTYDASAAETYLFNPSKDELRETNPLLYLKSASDYRIADSKNSKTGVETVILLPKTKDSGVKSVTIVIDSKTYLPKNIKVVTSNGITLSVALSNIKLNAELADSTFDYPKQKYPGVKITDLR